MFLGGECPFANDCDFTANLSCRFISYLANKDTFRLQMVDDEALAYDMTKRGKVWGYMFFHSDFSSAYNERLWNHLNVEELARG